MYIVYRLIRSDGQQYIGTTYEDGFKRRMTAHSKSERFDGFSFECEVLENSDDFEYIAGREEYYIKKYDTYLNGLNESVDGKGNHLCGDFTTKGFIFSEESRMKMRESAKKRIKRDGIPFKGCSHSSDQKEKWSRERKGKLPPNTRLTEELVIEIVDLFASQPPMENVGLVMKNGKKMSYVRAFCLKLSNYYGVTPEQMERIIRGKVWKNVERKYEI